MNKWCWCFILFLLIVAGVVVKSAWSSNSYDAFTYYFLSAENASNIFFPANQNIINVSQKNEAVRKDEEEIIVDDEEELIVPESTSTQNKLVDKKKLKDLSQQSLSDSGKAALQNDNTGKNLESPNALTEQTAGQIASDTDKVDQQIQQSVPKADTAKNVAVVENIQSINFSRNLKEYRSPRLAMLMSFILPGLGQGYARSTLKAVIFAAAEAIGIGTGIFYLQKGNNERNKVKDFAASHYSFERFEEFYRNLVEYLINVEHMDSADVFRELPFWDYDQFKENAQKKNSSYYSRIADADVVQGWDDAAPRYKADRGPDIGINDSLYARNDSIVYRVDRIKCPNAKCDPIQDALQFGYSDNRSKYNKMVSNANFYVRIAEYILEALLVNHIVSALDAGITAKAHNDKLLQRQSMWQRISIENQLVSGTPGSSCRGITLKIRL